MNLVLIASEYTMYSLSMPKETKTAPKKPRNEKLGTNGEMSRQESTLTDDATKRKACARMLKKTTMVQLTEG